MLEQLPPTGPLIYDRERIAAIETELHHDEAAWAAFFSDRGIVPLSLTYEAMAADPRTAVATILEAMGLDPGPAAQVPVATARLADDISRAWIERFRQEQT